MVWYSMIQRCYKECYDNKPTYLECSVCDEWLCYENFEKWFNENWYEVPDKTMCLDKDILIKGNKIYSPETCCFVPQEINKLFTTHKRFRGETVIGVNKLNDKFQASCNKYKQSISLGVYNTQEEAFDAYKNFKEQYIKEVADLYKEYIPQKLYNALYEYEIEITD